MKELYLVFIVIGLTINIILNYYLLRKNGVILKDNLFINIIQLITIILGSKILDFCVNYKYYMYYDLLHAIYSGYMFYGGAILSTCAIFIYCKIRNINYKNVFSVIIPNILLLYAFCKIGCFFNKCCVGINGLPLQPIESILCFISYIIVLKTSNKICISCIIFGIIRFISFLLRNNISMSNLIINEIISICIILIGIKTYLIRDS